VSSFNKQFEKIGAVAIYPVLDRIVMNRLRKYKTVSSNFNHIVDGKIGGGAINSQFHCCPTSPATSASASSWLVNAYV